MKIIAVDVSDHRLLVNRKADQLLLDGKVIGRPINDRLAGYLVYRYPQKFSTICFRTDEGGTYCLASREFEYFPGPDNSVRRCFAERKRFGKVQLTYPEAVRRIKVGLDLSQGLPIEWDAEGRFLTNLSNVEIPAQRPCGKEWARFARIASLRSISSANWQSMLKALEGKYVHRVLTLDRVRSEVEEMKRIERRKLSLEKKLQSLAIGQCYQPQSDAIKVIDVGENMVFFVTIGSRQLYAVDSPNYGRAFYLFEEYADAAAWATRLIDQSEARRRALVFHTHHNGWQDRVARSLASA